MRPAFNQQPTRRRVKYHLVMTLAILSIAALLLPASPAGAVVGPGYRRLSPPGPGGVTKKADLDISSLTSSGRVKVNDPSFWVVGVTNHGPDAATNVEVLWGQQTSNPADGANILSALAAYGFTCAVFPDPDGVKAIDCTGGSLGPGATAWILIVGYAPNHPLTLGSEARVQTKDSIDTNAGNNIKTTTTETIP